MRTPSQKRVRGWGVGRAHRPNAAPRREALGAGALLGGGAGAAFAERTLERDRADVHSPLGAEARRDPLDRHGLDARFHHLELERVGAERVAVDDDAADLAERAVHERERRGWIGGRPAEVRFDRNAIATGARRGLVIVQVAGLGAVGASVGERDLIVVVVAVREVGADERGAVLRHHPRAVARRERARAVAEIGCERGGVGDRGVSDAASGRGEAVDVRGAHRQSVRDPLVAEGPRVGREGVAVGDRSEHRCDARPDLGGREPADSVPRVRMTEVRRPRHPGASRTRVAARPGLAHRAEATGQHQRRPHEPPIHPHVRTVTRRQHRRPRPSAGFSCPSSAGAPILDYEARRPRWRATRAGRRSRGLADFFASISEGFETPARARVEETLN
jgi:hypothetical protein